MRDNSGVVRGALWVVLMFAASFADARHIDLGFSPTSADPRGGTEVRVYMKRPSESRFTAPQVFFGGVPSPSTTLVNPYEIKAITPPHAIGIVPVTVVEDGVVVGSADDFVFAPKLEEVIIPLALNAADASYGTRWSTEITVYNGADHAVSLDPQVCYSFAKPFTCSETRWVAPQSSLTIEPRRNDYGPIRLRPPAEDVDQLHFTVRLRELTRNATGPGVEVPVVRQRDFQRTRIAFPGISTDDAYRSTLRVLTRATLLTVRVRDESTGELLAERVMTLGRPTDIDPIGPVVFNELLASAAIRSRERVRVEVDGDTPVWAMLTLTHNATHRVDLFTPQ